MFLVMLEIYAEVIDASRRDRSIPEKNAGRPLCSAGCKGGGGGVGGGVEGGGGGGGGTGKQGGGGGRRRL